MPDSRLTMSRDTYVTKDELRAELERQAQRYTEVYGGEVVTYAAQPDPERKPWRKRSNFLDQQFERELEKIAKEKIEKEQQAHVDAGEDTDL